jgi:carbonic anhydrase
MNKSLLYGLFLPSFLLLSMMTVPYSSPKAAWQSLKKANETFVKDKKMAKQRARIPEVQNPSYVLLSCADSRVTPEYIFNQPLGSFFVVRVAGNVNDPLVTDSIEFAIRNFNPSVIIILGHSQCGAVRGAIDHLKLTNGRFDKPHDLYSTVLTPIEKAIEQAKIDIYTPDALTLATKANVRYSAEKLMETSPIIREKIKKGILSIVGAKYDLQTGAVTELFVY